MTIPRFIQVHALQSYPAALLNRDDFGLAKRITFGDAVRTRISSQCLKRNWRTTDSRHAIRNIDGATDGIRSRNIVDRRVMPALRSHQLATDAVLDSVQEAFNVGLYGRHGTQVHNRQPILLGHPEVEHLQQRAQAICTEFPDDAEAAAKAAQELFSVRHGEGRNFHAMLDQAALPAGITAAMFGRMVTADPAANLDAAIHVAHAFTVHAEESESDYFSAIDDLQMPQEPSAAFIGEAELTSGLFYSYVVVDVPTLVSNLDGCPAPEWQDADRQLASTVVHNLLHIIATVTPAAKRGSTAPYTRAEFVLVEAGDQQPRSLANAFQQPVRSLTNAAVQALAQYMEQLDAAYDDEGARRFMSVTEAAIPKAARLSMPDLAQWAGDAVLRAEVD